jgi:hypothetical protein
MVTRFFKWLCVDVLGWHWHDWDNWERLIFWREVDGNKIQTGNGLIRKCKTCQYEQIVKTY